MELGFQESKEVSTAGGAPDSSEPVKASAALEMERKPLDWRRGSALFTLPSDAAWPENAACLWTSSSRAYFVKYHG